jgi:hypothetical protein
MQSIQRAHRRSGPGLEAYFVIAVVRAAPAQHGLPERRERARIRTVNTGGLDTNRHTGQRNAKDSR